MKDYVLSGSCTVLIILQNSGIYTDGNSVKPNNLSLGEERDIRWKNNYMTYCSLLWGVPAVVEFTVVAGVRAEVWRGQCLSLQSQPVCMSVSLCIVRLCVTSDFSRPVLPNSGMSRVRCVKYGLEFELFGSPTLLNSNY
ncbi:hypothetical protein J6590_049489 [Homalodisca vitripennis]|nr:hypothetical protein J6590_049489 [Homalodisca vitripennis]